MTAYVLANAAAVFAGETRLRQGQNVLVVDGEIAAVGSEPIERADAQVIDLTGLTLMPGLIDAHAHITGLSLSPKNESAGSVDRTLAATHYLHNSLMMGFTTLREAGGADFAIAQLLERGEITGPRLFYSGRALTQTGGGGDFRCVKR